MLGVKWRAGCNLLGFNKIDIIRGEKSKNQVNNFFIYILISHIENKEFLNGGLLAFVLKQTGDYHKEINS